MNKRKDSMQLSSTGKMCLVICFLHTAAWVFICIVWWLALTKGVK